MFTDREWREAWDRDRIERILDAVKDAEKKQTPPLVKRKNGQLYICEEDSIPGWFMLSMLAAMIALLFGAVMMFGSLLLDESIRYTVARWGIGMFVVSAITCKVMEGIDPPKVWRKIKENEPSKDQNHSYRGTEKKSIIRNNVYINIDKKDHPLYNVNS